MSNKVEGSKTNSIPSWMKEKNILQVPTKRVFNSHFLQNSLLGFSKVIQNEVFSERYAKEREFLQMIDPRLKLVTLVFFMVFSGMTRSLLTLLFLTFVVSMYVKLSSLNFREYCKRVWMILPVLVFILSIPAATNIFIVGKPIFYVYNEFNFSLWFLKLPQELYFSLNGILSILRMALRIGVSFSLGYVLIMTTCWTQLTKSLKILRIPILISSILNLTYRYIFVLTKIAFEMVESRLLRTVGKTSNKQNRLFVANRISLLFIKSSFLSDEIYDAMRCRGFTGEWVSQKNFKLGRLDFLWIINNLLILFILMVGEWLF